MTLRTRFNWRNHKDTLSKLLTSLFFIVPTIAQAETYISIEGGGTWQTRNDQAIPGDTGTRFSIADFDHGPIANYRLYFGHKWSNRHELRFLYAPLELELDGQLDKSVVFLNSTFAPNVNTVAFYKFNSYRVTYAYHFEENNGWSWALGFTGKVRDAEVRLTQGALTEAKKNIGFVPLLHLQVRKAPAALWQFRLDFDGLVAPQGRAIDLGIFLEKQFSGSEIFMFAGYRTVEGGADNVKVYNLAWFHTATLGLRAGL